MNKNVSEAQEEFVAMNICSPKELNFPKFSTFKFTFEQILV